MSLTAYVQDYLKEEVFAEGLTRNVPAFSRFLMHLAIHMVSLPIMQTSPVIAAWIPRQSRNIIRYL